jgi:hypothetical protein
MMEVCGDHGPESLVDLHAFILPPINALLRPANTLIIHMMLQLSTTLLTSNIAPVAILTPFAFVIS